MATTCPPTSTMRLTPFVVAALTISSTPVAASWWSTDKPGMKHHHHHHTELSFEPILLHYTDYTSWDKRQLEAWLHEHNIETPKGYSQKDLEELVKSNWQSSSAWTRDQYDRAQQVFSNYKDSAFDTWDDSRLREFLLEQGVVAPSGPREKLVLAAKQYYRGYTDAAASYASTASHAASSAIYGDEKDQASKSATSLYSKASNTASSVAGQASNTVSSVAAQASESAVRALDDSKDYVYSTWDDNRLRSYLEEKGVIETKQQATRDQLLAYMRDSYAKVSNPVWDAWSDSYMVSTIPNPFHHILTLVQARVARRSWTY